MRILIYSLLPVTLFLSASDSGRAQEQVVLFDELCGIVENNFYSPEKIEETFRNVKPAYRERAHRVSDPGEFARLVNELLDELNTSHTAYFTQDDPAYYQLAAIFHRLPTIRELFEHEEITYPSAGILTRQFEERTFIIAVLDGGPAARAGVLAGDELVAVDNEPYAGVASFREKVGQRVTLTLRRDEKAAPIQIEVIPEEVNPGDEFLAAQEASIRLIEKGGFKLGYIHIWSYAGLQFHEAFEAAIASGKLREADGLIWDLRNGWGGAAPDYLNIFNSEVPVYTRIDRDGNEFVWDTQWRKPVVMLVNGGVRSGKEILAFGFKKYRLGKIVGERTAGAVSAGKLFVLSDGSLLYLAVGAARIDGEVLEGKGVSPDVPVPMDIRYQAGRDRQLEEAILTLREMLE